MTQLGGFTLDEVCTAMKRMSNQGVLLINPAYDCSRDFYDTLELPTGWTPKDEKDLRAYISETIEPMRLTH